MAHIERSALVMHSAERMFALVCDVQSYPQFLPWCVDAHLVSETDEELVAGMTIRKGGIEQRFTTRNVKQAPDWMSMELIDGPFSKLNGKFSFKPLSDQACKVILELDFEVAGKILSLTLSPVFKQAANTMVDAFVQRADAVYGV
ncbi:MAG: ribosome-associated toxin RatA of RatAB toxin-antitoxin module [Oceanicoccus sp.]|jgi:ribosome-associated toxin RatA of RatAB toxin-antitoxin module